MKYKNFFISIKNKNYSHGVAMSVALWMFVVVIAIGTGALIFMSGSYLSASKHRHEQGAYYCAYGGIMYAKVKLDENPTFTGETLNLPTGTAVVTVSGTTITSVGRYGQNGKVLATRTIQADIDGDSIIKWQNQ